MPQQVRGGDEHGRLGEDSADGDAVVVGGSLVEHVGAGHAWCNHGVGLEFLQDRVGNAYHARFTEVLRLRREENSCASMSGCHLSTKAKI